MEPEGGAEEEAEGEEKGIEVETLGALAPGGKDLEVILGHIMVTTEVQAPFTQGLIPWMDLMDPAGEEKMWAGISNKPMKTRIPELKTPGSLAKSREEDNKVKRVTIQRRATDQEGVRDHMMPKKKTPPQTPGRELRGAEQVQTSDMMIITTDTLRQSDGKDQSNRPDHQLKKKPTQREEPVSKRTLAITEHLRVLPVKPDEAQDDTHPFRPEGAGDRINKTTGWAKESGTRCPRAKRRRQGV